MIQWALAATAVAAPAAALNELAGVISAVKALNSCHCKAPLSRAAWSQLMEMPGHTGQPAGGAAVTTATVVLAGTVVSWQLGQAAQQPAIFSCSQVKVFLADPYKTAPFGGLPKC